MMGPAHDGQEPGIGLAKAAYMTASDFHHCRSHRFFADFWEESP